MKIKIFFVYIALFVTFPAYADLNDGIAAVKRGDYTRAELELLPIAEKGDIKAQFMLGAMYKLQKNLDKALYWLHRSAEQGYGDGQAGLGFALLENGKNVNDALAWCQKSAFNKNAMGQICMGHIYAEGIGVTKNGAEAERWYLQSASQGNPDHQLLLADLYGSGRGITKDDVKAHKWYAKAAEQ